MPRLPTFAIFILAVSLSGIDALGGDSKAAVPFKRQRISDQGRFELIRSLNAELAYVRKPFPMGPKGLTLKPDGSITPAGEELETAMAMWGPSARPPERVRITDVVLKGNKVLLEINGGPKKKKKWWQRIQLSGPAGVSVTGPQRPENPRGSVLTVEFEDYIPEMAPNELKAILAPVFDFSSVSPVQAYLETIPPKAKEAIKNHQVLVGMNREMVTYAKGRPPRKHREKDDTGAEYEEWIYGEPPQQVEFVRFVGDEVVRLTIMKVDGEKLVRSEKEIDLETAVAKKQEGPGNRPASAPTLRRAGEEPPESQNTIRVPRGARDPDTHDPTMGPPPGPPPQQPQPLPPPTDPGR
ncbi:MAG TPA: hypothetical protein VGQ71_06090 [Terriglobales bacterium]|nr:hypothetical protein [Terriglobales bacterium]